MCSPNSTTGDKAKVCLTAVLCLCCLVPSKPCLLNPARELLRHHKTLGLPEPLVTPSQLARIRELQLPLSDAAAATLTYAQVCTHNTELLYDTSSPIPSFTIVSPPPARTSTDIYSALATIHHCCMTRAIIIVQHGGGAQLD